MAKWKAGNLAGMDEPEALKGFAPYDGPALPFSGIFPMKLKMLRMKVNRNGDDMLNGLLEVYAPNKKDPKFKWHGAPVWFNLNQTEVGAPFTKAFLDGMGVKWIAFLGKTLLDDNEDPPTVTRLGTLKLDGNQTVKVALKGSKVTATYPEKKAEVGAWLKWDGKDADIDSEDVDDEDDEDIDEDDLDNEDEDAPPF